MKQINNILLDLYVGLSPRAKGRHTCLDKSLGVDKEMINTLVCMSYVGRMIYCVAPLRRSYVCTCLLIS